MTSLRKIAKHDGITLQTAWYRTEHGRSWWDKYKESKKYKARRRAYEKAYKAANLHKLRAKWSVAYAVKTGKLTKSACEVCGDKAADAHHDDYGKPLDVRWLCHTHHMQQTFR